MLFRSVCRGDYAVEWRSESVETTVDDSDILLALLWDEGLEVFTPFVDELGRDVEEDELDGHFKIRGMYVGDCGL